MGQKCYYVSSLGDDGQNGRTPASSWKTLGKVSSMIFEPGDHILLKAGDVWEEALYLNGSGTFEEPIILTSYDQGPKPKIQYGDGDVITLVNEKGWCIKGLEVECTTCHPIVPKGFKDAETGLELTGAVVFTGSAAINRGIKVEYNLDGVWGDVCIADNVVHGKGINQRSEGIVVFAACASGKLEERARNITITNNVVYDVGWRAIGTAGRDLNSQLLLPGSALFSNVAIIGNTVYNIGVQGIVLGNSNHGVMERNVVHDAGLYEGQGISWGPSGLWPICCSYIDIRFNEVYNMSSSNSGRDATGIDIDWRCDHITVQYNYTHDNLGNGIVTMACKDSRIVNNKVCGNVCKVNVGNGQIGLSDYTSDPSDDPVTGVRDLEIMGNIIIVDQEGTAALSSMYITPGNSWEGNSFVENDIVYPQGHDGTSCYHIGENTELHQFEGNRFHGMDEQSFLAVYHRKTYHGFEDWGKEGHDNNSCFFPIGSKQPGNVAAFKASKDTAFLAIQLTWDKPADEDGKIAHYNLYRAYDPDFMPSYRTMIGEAAETEYLDSGVHLGTSTVYYKIEAEDHCGNVSAIPAETFIQIVSDRTETMN